MLDSNAKIKFPENDGANSIFNITFGLPAAQALHVAHQLNLFELIHSNRCMTLSAITQALLTQSRPTQALLSMCASLDYIKLNSNHEYELTETAKTYLLKESPFYVGGALDMTIMNAEVYSFNSLKDALFRDSSQVYEGKDLFQTNEQQAELAKIFTHCMHGKSMTMAGLWPHKMDLSRNKIFLDIGGGSGAHSISVISRWPHLNAIVYDRPTVCEVAAGYVQQFKLNDRIETTIGDMWSDSFPQADIHFYSDILHDWPLDKCEFLLEKSFESLPSKGRIIIHEMLFNDTKSGPTSTASYNIMMLLWTQGQQLSKKELTTLLAKIGFIEVQVISTGFGDWNLISAEKP